MDNAVDFIKEHIFETVVSGAITVVTTGFGLALKYIVKRTKQDIHEFIEKQEERFKQLAENASSESSEQQTIKTGLISILHDKIYHLCTQYLDEGEISTQDLKNLEYLYEGYSGLGGNGTGEELYNRCKKLPLKHE